MIDSLFESLYTITPGQLLFILILLVVFAIIREASYKAGFRDGVAKSEKGYWL